MGDFINGSQLARYVSEDESRDQEVIAYMYANRIIIKYQTVECSRWGILFKPIDLEEVDEIVVATHEAGHAIVYMDLGAKFKYLELGPESAGAHVEKIFIPDVERQDSEEFWRQSDADAISVAGGPIATSKLFHNSPSIWDVGAADDFVTLCTLEMHNTYQDVELMVNKAREIVEKQWESVKAIADHLQRFKRVRFVQCMRIADKIRGAS